MRRNITISFGVLSSSTGELIGQSYRENFTFLPISFQARIGNMDGILVAYHNTARIFGFQYVSLEEMEERLYGSGNGARVFNKCVSLLERVLSDVASVYGERVCLFYWIPSVACLPISVEH